MTLIQAAAEETKVNYMRVFLLMVLICFAWPGVSVGTLAAKGPPAGDPVIVDSTDPAVALQGETGKQIKILGSGFKGVTKVAFYVTGTQDSGGVKVMDAVYNPETGNIDTVIDIYADAVISDYDIEVQTYGGRKGKGTAKFSVQQNIVYCDEAFELDPDTECNCRFTPSPSAANILHLNDNCSTDGTLYLGNYRFNGTASEFTITARVNGSTGAFNGRSVVAAKRNLATFRDMHIHLEADIDAGCGGSQLNSFISYVLDSADNMTGTPSLMLVWDNLLTSNGPAVCHGIEAVRGVDTGSVPDFKVAVEGNVLADDTWQCSGILFQGFGPMEDRAGARLSVSANTIGYAAENGDCATNAIQFGKIVGPGGLVEDNVISTDAGTGILVTAGVTGADSSTSIGHNVIQGASVAILADETISRAEITSNTLLGDGIPGSGDVGICTDAGSSRTRPNKISGFDEDINEGDCTADFARPWPY